MVGVLERDALAHAATHPAAGERVVEPPSDGLGASLFPRSGARRPRAVPRRQQTHACPVGGRTRRPVSGCPGRRVASKRNAAPAPSKIE
jgi:hypothetical protein